MNGAATNHGFVSPCMPRSRRPVPAHILPYVRKVLGSVSRLVLLFLRPSRLVLFALALPSVPLPCGLPCASIPLPCRVHAASARLPRGFHAASARLPGGSRKEVIMVGYLLEDETARMLWFPTLSAERR